jgi:hypothetical protein
MIAAAHAACFSMALSGQLGNAGMTAESIETTATVTMEPVDGKPTVISSHLLRPFASRTPIARSFRRQRRTRRRLSDLAAAEYEDYARREIGFGRARPYGRPYGYDVVARSAESIRRSGFARSAKSP